MVLPVLSSAVPAEAPRDRSGMAGGALNTFRQLGFAVGVAIYGTLFPEQKSYAAGLSDATVVAGGFALVAAIIVVATVRRRVDGPVKTG